MSDPNELVQLKDMECPVCHECGSAFLVMNPRHHLRRYETSKGPIFIHLYCIDQIVQEWVDRYLKKTQ